MTAALTDGVGVKPCLRRPVTPHFTKEEALVRIKIPGVGTLVFDLNEVYEDYRCVYFNLKRPKESSIHVEV